MSGDIIKLIAFADGACKNNNSHSVERAAGSGYIIFPDDRKLTDEILFDEKNATLSALRSKIIQNTNFICIASCLKGPVDPPNKQSNNRAELHAFNGVLARCLLLGKQKISIIIKPDSEYVIKVFYGANNWRKNEWKLASGTIAANIDLASEMLSYLESLQRAGHEVKVQHVDAHQTEPNKQDRDKWFNWFFNNFADRLSNIGSGEETDINYNEKKRKRSKTKDAKK